MLIYIMPNFIPSFKPHTLLEQERIRLQINHEEQTAEWQRVRTAGNWDGWTRAWNEWFTKRQNDNNLSTNDTPSTDVLPNKSICLTPDIPQDIRSFPNPTKWTPLVVKGRHHSYVTYNWDTVRSTCFSADEEANILQRVMAKVPTETERIAEIVDLLRRTMSLSEVQKVTAEFWTQSSITDCP